MSISIDIYISIDMYLNIFIYISIYMGGVIINLHTSATYYAVFRVCYFFFFLRKEIITL